jgi:hypothetical protein
MDEDQTNLMHDDQTNLMDDAQTNLGVYGKVCLYYFLTLDFLHWNPTTTAS